MISLIIDILLLIVLAVFVALNVPYTTDVNLFGHVTQGVSSVAVILISIVVGVLFSFFFYLGESMRKSRKTKEKRRLKELKEKEKLIAKVPQRDESKADDQKQIQKQPRLFDRFGKRG
ncbi:lipopolysaccharide assembly protein LapA domain-containing protein [Sediminispirochaeta bajacaliforniensis]|uniref:lipopolysaccharide assembly protein LapA domain-containing protein n=1 Tax=Sediminispirochaeta bajacaliforniensis TaxID=148 RepID=UPI00037EE419|nr:lipopolysaccharide assembly protein LapA domain-containing protein [Sediminispirochaeta bajacaliforniensis]